MVQCVIMGRLIFWVFLTFGGSVWASRCEPGILAYSLPELAARYDQRIAEFQEPKTTVPNDPLWLGIQGEPLLKVLGMFCREDRLELPIEELEELERLTVFETAKRLAAIWDRRPPVRETRRRTMSISATEGAAERIFFSGIPESVVKVKTPPTSFRFIDESESLLARIQNTGVIEASPYQFWKDEGTDDHFFDDIGGLYIAAADSNAKEFALSPHSSFSYVDFELKNNFPLYQVSPKVFLIPLPMSTMPWVTEVCKDAWIGNPVSAELKSMCDLKLSQGGIGPQYRVEIVPKRSGKVDFNTL